MTLAGSTCEVVVSLAIVHETTQHNVLTRGRSRRWVCRLRPDVGVWITIVDVYLELILLSQGRVFTMLHDDANSLSMLGHIDRV